MQIDLERACQLVCPYCKMGMPLESDTMHKRRFGEFMEAGTDDRYPCEAMSLRRVARQAAQKTPTLRSLRG